MLEDGSRERIDALFAAYDRPRTPGLHLVVLQSGSPVYERGFGRAEIDHDVPWSAATRTRIASLTKQMVALLLVELEAAGHLSLTEALGAELAELPDYSRTVTIDDCLLHLSGLRSDEPVADLAGWTFSSPVTLDALYRLTCRQAAPQRAPGAAFDYNDAGYRLVVRWAERRMGQPINTLLTERLFAPLGMRDTAMTYDEHGSLAGDAHMYDTTAEGVRHLFWGRASSGDGGVSTTMGDLLRWYTGVLREAERTAPLLEKPRLRADVAPFARRGLFTGRHRARRWIGHTGMGGCGLYHFPDDDLGIAFFGNRSDLRRHTVPFRVYDAIWPERAVDGAAALIRQLEVGGSGASFETLVDPACGDVVRLVRAASGVHLSYFGQAAYLAPADDGGFVSVDGLLSARATPLGPQHWNIDLGFGRLQTFVAPRPAEVSITPGLYVSNEVGGVLGLEALDDGSVLARFAEGPTPALTRPMRPVGPRTWFDGVALALHLPPTSGDVQVHGQTARGLHYTFAGGGC